MTIHPMIGLGLINFIVITVKVAYKVHLKEKRRRRETITFHDHRRDEMLSVIVAAGLFALAISLVIIATQGA